MAALCLYATPITGPVGTPLCRTPLSRDLRRRNQGHDLQLLYPCAAEQLNECWQADFTLTDGTGSEVLT